MPPKQCLVYKKSEPKKRKFTIDNQYNPIWLRDTLIGMNRQEACIQLLCPLIGWSS